MRLPLQGRYNLPGVSAKCGQEGTRPCHMLSELQGNTGPSSDADPESKVALNNSIFEDGKIGFLGYFEQVLPCVI